MRPISAMLLERRIAREARRTRPERRPWYGLLLHAAKLLDRHPNAVFCGGTASLAIADAARSCPPFPVERGLLAECERLLMRLRAKADR